MVGLMWVKKVGLPFSAARPAHLGAPLQTCGPLPDWARKCQNSKFLRVLSREKLGVVFASTSKKIKF
jgi:hypothetical protein